MADDKHNQSRPVDANQNQSQTPKDRDKTTSGLVFTACEVSSLVRYVEEDGNKIYALLAGIRALLPKDKLGDFEDPNVASLIDIAQDIVGDVSFLGFYKGRINEIQGGNA